MPQDNEIETEVSPVAKAQDESLIKQVDLDELADTLDKDLTEKLEKLVREKIADSEDLIPDDIEPIEDHEKQGTMSFLFYGVGLIALVGGGIYFMNRQQQEMALAPSEAS